MSSVLASARSSAPPERPTLPTLDSRASLLDRLAMRLALRLLLWSTRSRPEPLAHSERVRLRQESELREQKWRLEALSVPLY
jgi:hypothetical protein